jgi:hypothetical protein
MQMIIVQAGNSPKIRKFRNTMEKRKKENEFHRATWTKQVEINWLGRKRGFGAFAYNRQTD